jgi:hypothetical protein
MRRGGALGDGVVLNRKCRNSRHGRDGGSVAAVSDRRRRSEIDATTLWFE